MSLNYARAGNSTVFATKMIESAQIPKFETYKVTEMVLTPPPTLLQNKDKNLLCPSGKMQVIWAVLNESHKVNLDCKKGTLAGRKRKHED